MEDVINYPIVLDQSDISELLPHRGEALFLRRVTVLTHNHYQGEACWSSSSGMLQGHFPAFSVVPGVLLVEAAAQVAGAGMFAGDPVARAQRSGRIGVLASIRKCAFKSPVYPERPVHFDVTCRQIGPHIAQVKANIHVDAREVADIEILLANTTLDQVTRSADALAGKSATIAPE